MGKVFGAILAIFVAFNIFITFVPAGRSMWNDYTHELKKVDERQYESKKKVEDMISSLASGISSKMIWSIIFALKIISGIVCAVSFFSVLGLIENGSLSPASGIACTLLIAVLECLCFVPMGNRPGSKGKQK